MWVCLCYFYSCCMNKNINLIIHDNSLYNYSLWNMTFKEGKIQMSLTGWAYILDGNFKTLNLVREWKCKYVYREANRPDDWLAAHLVSAYKISTHLALLIDEDQVGGKLPRGQILQFCVFVQSLLSSPIIHTSTLYFTLMKREKNYILNFWNVGFHESVEMCIQFF